MDKQINMENPNSDLIAGFIGGTTAGGVVSIKVWFAQVMPQNIPADIALKIMATIIISFCGGVFGMLAKDVYTHIIKPKLFKKIKP
jgi:hypothetical protein